MTDYGFFVDSVNNPKIYKTDAWDYWEMIRNESPDSQLISESNECIEFRAKHAMELGSASPPAEFPEDLRDFLQLHDGGTLFLAGRDYRIMSGQDMLVVRKQWQDLYPDEYSDKVLRFCDMEDSAYIALVQLEAKSVVVFSEGVSDTTLISWAEKAVLVPQGNRFSDWLKRLIERDGVDVECGWDWANLA